jgi:hypothetical protein
VYGTEVLKGKYTSSLFVILSGVRLGVKYISGIECEKGKEEDFKIGKSRFEVRRKTRN